jgi:hypothetical protein
LQTLLSVTDVAGRRFLVICPLAALICVQSPDSTRSFGTPRAIDLAHYREITTSGGDMSQRETTLLWLRDILEQLSTNQQRLEWTTDREAARVLTETMLRDLERCTRLCETLRQRGLQRALAER